MIFAASVLYACLGWGAAVTDVADSEPVLSATLIRVVDGDTIEVRLESGPITVRLHGIDTPERRQSFGSAATKALRSLLDGEALEIEPIEQTDGYGRMVARVFVRGRDLNALMVETGFAWAYRRYLRRQPADEEYCRLEGAARSAGRGLWVGSPDDWQPPWDYRTDQRGRDHRQISYANETVERCLAAIGPGHAGSVMHGSPVAGAGPAGCRIKGNINSRGERIFHSPGMPSYASTRIDPRRGERWFCTAGEAEAAGWRSPR